MVATVAMVAMKLLAVPCQGQEELEVQQQELRDAGALQGSYERYEYLEFLLGCLMLSFL
jgi:hypothetical protein